MKKLILALTIILGASSAMTTLAADPSSKEQQKEMKQKQKKAEKTAKKHAKEFKKAGWEIQGSVDLETALINHTKQLKAFGGPAREVTGQSLGKKSSRIAVAEARSEAIRQYVEEQHMAVKGKIVDELGDMSEVERENFLNAYEAIYSTELKGEMQSSVKMLRKQGDRYDAQVLFLIDEEGAHSAAVRSMQRAAEQQQISLDIAKRISDWINED